MGRTSAATPIGHRWIHAFAGASGIAGSFLRIAADRQSGQRHSLAATTGITGGNFMHQQ